MNQGGQPTLGRRKSTGSEKAAGIFGGLCLFVVAGFFFSNDSAWGLVPLAFGLGVLVKGFLKRATAECPNCKYQFATIREGDHWLLCPSCKKYLEVKPWPSITQSEQRLEIIPDNYICEDPYLIFQIKMPRGVSPKWPPECCICGKPVAGRGAAKLTVQGFGSVSVRIQQFEIGGIPYCAEHYRKYTEKKLAGVKLAPRSDEAMYLIDPDKGDYQFVLTFCSYAYFRAFRELNHW